jgi:hypothetical protein
MAKQLKSRLRLIESGLTDAMPMTILCAPPFELRSASPFKPLSTEVLQEAFVYIIRSLVPNQDEHFKIGFSVNPRSRRDSLQTGN